MEAGRWDNHPAWIMKLEAVDARDRSPERPILPPPDPNFGQKPFADYEGTAPDYEAIAKAELEAERLAELQEDSDKVSEDDRNQFLLAVKDQRDMEYSRLEMRLASVKEHDEDAKGPVEEEETRK